MIVLEFLTDIWSDWGGLLIPAITLIVFIIALIARIKKHKSTREPLNITGLIGKLLGALVFRGLPRSITGDPSTGHVQKPDFSYDDSEEDVINHDADKESNENRRKQR